MCDMFSDFDSVSFANYKNIQISKKLSYVTLKNKNYKNRKDGDDIIDIILEQKQCARYICEKVYSYFVNEELDVH